MNNNITGTIVQLNEYPPDKFNVLIPVTTMQVMSNLQRIIVNKVQLDVADPENSKDIYREQRQVRHHQGRRHEAGRSGQHQHRRDRERHDGRL